MLSAIDLSWTPEDDEAAVRLNQVWLDEFYAAMRPFTSDESFQNFIEEAETNYLRAYYGANLERLVEIKRKYDPDNPDVQHRGTYIDGGKVCSGWIHRRNEDLPRKVSVRLYLRCMK